MPSLSNIPELIYKHLQGELNDQERRELHSWAAASEENKIFFNQVSDAVKVLKESSAQKERLDKVNVQEAWEKLKLQGLPPEPFQHSYSGKLYRINFRRIAVAASVVIVVTAGLWFAFRKQSTPLPDVVVKTEVAKDASPKSQLAKIVLDDGREIILDSVSSGVVASQGNMKIVKQSNGSINYTPDGGDEESKIAYNTVLVPKGGDVVHLTLEDNSQVWLNAESSIRYPTRFKGEERRVEISGEVYFEVTSSSEADGRKRSFIVTKGNMNIVVLGTKFNVNTYANEPNIKVTLLEGSVKVENKVDTKVIGRTIKPGEQAILSDAKIQVDNKIDLQQVMAWKNGKFVFKSTNIQVILRQMSRWYDLDSSHFKDEEVRAWNFTGEISRYNKASAVLEMLERTGGGIFKIEGRKIIISK